MTMRITPDTHLIYTTFVMMIMICVYHKSMAQKKTKSSFLLSHDNDAYKLKNTQIKITHLGSAPGTSTC